jgi:hypothetical protein
MKDGMTSESFAVDQLDVGSAVASVVLSGASLAVASGQIDATELASSSVDSDELAAGAVITTKHALIGTGSPPVYCDRILHGSAAIPSATSVWVVFGDTFKTNTPDVLISGNVAGDVDIFEVSGSQFMASGTNATIFYWSAMGSA